MDREKQRAIARKGGESVPNEKRSFSQNRRLAAEAGRKGGQSVNPAMRSFSLNHALAIVDRFPDEGSLVELLCVDHNGTYVVPYPCRRVEDAWRNVETNDVIEANVAGWRQRRSQAPASP
jgi:hypothetical protein